MLANVLGVMLQRSITALTDKERMSIKAKRDPKTGTWLIQYRYTDWTGQRKKSTKRGFKTKREAEEWLCQFLSKQEASLDITFAEFIDIYYEDIGHRLRESTLRNKKYMIALKGLPYFGKKRMCDIKAADIRKWQSELIAYRDDNGKPYSQTYLRAINNQLSAIINFAVRYYDLPSNPCRKAGSMGKNKADGMRFWLKEDYLKFAEVMMDKPQYYYAFEMLYWTGIRVGELMAICPSDIDFAKGNVSISKSYQRIDGEDVITPPKTEKSKRIITMPQFLIEEIQEYLIQLYGIGPNDRMFCITKSGLHREMDRGAREAGVERIRIHDLRHSHVSLLIDMGFSALAIADRLGHESIDITYNYAHLFPSKQTEMAKKLDMERGM